MEKILNEKNANVVLFIIFLVLMMPVFHENMNPSNMGAYAKTTQQATQHATQQTATAQETLSTETAPDDTNADIMAEQECQEETAPNNTDYVIIENTEIGVPAYTSEGKSAETNTWTDKSMETNTWADESVETYTWTDENVETYTWTDESVETYSSTNENMTDYVEYAPANLTALEEEILYYHNVHRNNAGLPSLIPVQSLCDVAAIRAWETTVCFSHTRPDGSQWSTVSYEVDGENLYRGNQNAGDIVWEWICSPKHYENVVRAEYQTCGLAVAEVNGLRYCAFVYGS